MSVQPIPVPKPSLTLKRRLKATPDKVYAAWTDPEKILKWFGPEAGSGASAPGRRACRRQLTRSPSTPRMARSIDVSGHYREVVPNEKLVFTWAWRTMPERESLVTVLIKPDGAGSLLTLIHEQFFDEAARDRHREGWSAASTSSSVISRNQGDRHGTGRSQEDATKPQRPRTQSFHGSFCWNELMTRDIEGAKRFYRDTIGWSFEPMKMDWGTYWIAKSGDKNVGGMFELTSPEFDGVPNGWMSYLAVDDVDARVAKAMKAGGKLMRPIFDVPGVGRIAILMQPDGAGVAWMTPSPN